MRAIIDMTQTLRRQQGFTLMTAIFLLVILSVLGAFMVTFTGLQQANVQSDVQGIRAFYAARAGAEWAVFRALDPDDTIAPGAGAFAACPSGTISGLAGSLSPFTVTVTCNSNDYTEGNRNIRVWQITATACTLGTCPGTTGAGYVERKLVISVTRCKDPSASSPKFYCTI